MPLRVWSADGIDEELETVAYTTIASTTRQIGATPKRHKLAKTASASLSAQIY